MKNNDGRDLGLGTGDWEAPKAQPLAPSPQTLFWRSLEEQAGDPAFQELLYNEFPSQIEAITDPVARRTFLKLMGASLALAGVTACTKQPPEKIVPYVRQPEELIPGKPLFYATSMALGGVATGLLVESHEGRPTKIEGNPLHPGSLGATDVFAQAAILGLYDPDRSKTLRNLGEIRPWSAFLGAMNAALTAQKPLKGAGLRILTESISSPTLAAQIRDLLARFPSAKWHQWDPASRDNARAGARLAFGEYVDAQYHLDQADVILSLDADFLGGGPGALRYAREFAKRRRPEDAEHMNRLYAIESMPTSTGSRADHRLPMRPSAVERAAREIAAAVGVAGTGRSSGSEATPSLKAAEQKWIAAVARDLAAHRGRSLVIAGDGQPPVVHALAHAMNQALGNERKTVAYTQTVEAEPIDQLESITALTADMNAGKVDVLVIVGGNPVYTAPVDLKFADALNKVQLRAHLNLYDDETSALCQWHIPEAHFLEAWSDARAFDGTASIVQPLIAPLYGGKSAHEVLAAMSERPERSGHDLVRAQWKIDKDETEWRRWLHDGVIPNSAFAPKNVSVVSGFSRTPEAPAASGIEISFRNDPSVLDGRFANNGWLQELPKPITRLTWDNAVLTSPATADRLKGSEHPAFQGGEHGQIITDVVELKLEGRTVRGALFAVVGHPDDCVTVHLGYGRSRGGRIAAGAGFNANAIRTSSCAVVRRWSGSHEDRRDLLARLHAVPPPHGGPCPRARGHARGIPARSEVGARRARHGAAAAEDAHAVSRGEVRRLQVGHGDRPELLHRLQCLRRRPARRRTTFRSSARSRCCAGARCTGCASTPTIEGAADESGDVFPAGAVHAVRERAVRSRSARSPRRRTATKGSTT